MPKNDEGEFELVLGNRQLISVFLIVVILLGVFFSMGYIVGRNSASAVPPADTARNSKSASSKAADDSPLTADTTDTDAAAAEEPATAPESPDGKAPAPAAEAPVTTQPAQAAAPPQAKPAPPPAPKQAKPAPSPAPAAAPAPAPQRAALAGQPAAGQYWQVVATTRPDAEIIAEALGKKGLHAILAPAPREGIFRVLVGPMPDAPTQAQTRINLEAAGFKNPILRKY